MRDNLRRYRARRQALVQGYPKNPRGNLARRLHTLAARISGIVGSESSQLPKIARHVPDGNQTESRVQRLTRWVSNDQVTEARSFLPSAAVWLRCVALETRVRVMDGRVVGRGCVALLGGVVSTGSVLPLAWLVRQGKTGHVPEDLHMTRVAPVKPLGPKEAQVVLRGDGACDGIRFQHTLNDEHWSSVCRTGSTITGAWDGDTCRCETVGACIKPGNLVEWIDAHVTHATSGPVRLICWWAKG
jgi:hypothetical protein